MLCRVSGCLGPVKAREMCSTHYQRERKHGDVNRADVDMSRRPPRRTSVVERLKHFSEWTEDGCLTWNGTTDGRGYGQLKVDGKLYKAYRLAYEIWVEQIPNGLLVRHKCDNRLCINPDHLETGTPKDNTADMLSRGRGRWQKRTP